MTYCLDCLHIRRSLFDVPRCAAMRFSWIDPHDSSELYPCAAVNVSGECEQFQSRDEKQMKLRLEKP